MAIFNKKGNKTTKESKKPEEKEETKKENMKQLYEKEELKKSVKDKKIDSNYKDAYRVLIKPLVTEKATDLGALNKYVFLVANSANKLEVSKAIKAVYGIKPLAVNIVKMEGKNVRRGRIRGKRKDFKKAIITLAKDQHIQVYEGV